MKRAEIKFLRMNVDRFGWKVTGKGTYILGTVDFDLTIGEDTVEGLQAVVHRPGGNEDLPEKINWPSLYRGKMDREAYTDCVRAYLDRLLGRDHGIPKVMAFGPNVHDIKVENSVFNISLICRFEDRSDEA